MKKQAENTDRLKPLNIQGLELKDVLEGVMKAGQPKAKERNSSKKKEGKK